jgi:hypothetical protein
VTAKSGKCICDPINAGPGCCFCVTPGTCGPQLTDAQALLAYEVCHSTQTPQTDVMRGCSVRACTAVAPACAGTQARLCMSLGSSAVRGERASLGRVCCVKGAEAPLCAL